MSEPRQKPPQRTVIGPLARAGGVLVVGGLALVLGSLFLPSYAKQEAIRAASARGITLAIDEASGGYSAVHFHHVSAVVPDVRGLTVTVSDIDVDLVWLKPRRARVLGVDVVLDGPVAETLARVTLWYRAHSTKDAETVADGLRVEVPRARIAWSHAFRDDGRLDAEEVSGELAPKVSARLGDELHFTTSRLKMTSKVATIGPWRLDLEEDADATTLRVAFDPPVPDGPHAILRRMAAEKTQLDVNIPRSPLYRLGIPPGALGGFKQTLEQAEMRLHYVRSVDDHVDATLTAGFFGVKRSRGAAPADVRVSGSLAGPGSMPLPLEGGVVTVGPVRVALSGPVTLRPDGGVSAKLQWKTAPIPCAQLLPRPQRAAGDLSVQLGTIGAGNVDLASLGLDVTALAQAAGLAKLEGDLSASGTVAFDSSDPANPTFTLTAKNSCGVALFSPP